MGVPARPTYASSIGFFERPGPFFCWASTHGATMSHGPIRVLLTTGMGAGRSGNRSRHLFTTVRDTPARRAIWAGLLEVPIQVPLLRVAFGAKPALNPAFYLTALVFHLFEAAPSWANWFMPRLADIRRDRVHILNNPPPES